MQGPCVHEGPFGLDDCARGVWVAEIMLFSMADYANFACQLPDANTAIAAMRQCVRVGLIWLVWY